MITPCKGLALDASVILCLPLSKPWWSRWSVRTPCPCSSALSLVLFFLPCFLFLSCVSGSCFLLFVCLLFVSRSSFVIVFLLVALFVLNHNLRIVFALRLVFLLLLLLSYSQFLIFSFINPFWDNILVLFLLLYLCCPFPVFICASFLQASFLTSPCRTQLAFIFGRLVLLFFRLELLCFDDWYFSFFFFYSCFYFVFVVSVLFIVVFIFYLGLCVVFVGSAVLVSHCDKETVLSLQFWCFGVRLVQNLFWSACFASFCWKPNVPQNIPTQTS